MIYFAHLTRMEAHACFPLLLPGSFAAFGGGADAFPLLRVSSNLQRAVYLANPDPYLDATAR
jgi:hypothetical protein